MALKGGCEWNKKELPWQGSVSARMPHVLRIRPHPPPAKLRRPHSVRVLLQAKLLPLRAARVRALRRTPQSVRRSKMRVRPLPLSAPPREQSVLPPRVRPPRRKRQRKKLRPPEQQPDLSKTALRLLRKDRRAAHQSKRALVRLQKTRPPNVPHNPKNPSPRQ